MNERKITMQAIRYLAQVAEAINGEICSGGCDDRGAVEASMKCADHIEHIAQYDVEEVGLPQRLRCVADSMTWLASVRQKFDATLSRSRLNVPSIMDLDALGETATVQIQ